MAFLRSRINLKTNQTLWKAILKYKIDREHRTTQETIIELIIIGLENQEKRLENGNNTGLL